MVKERNEQTGGEVIAAGGYGCVFAPPLPCANKPRELMESRRPAGVSKLLKETDLDEEVKIAKIVYAKVKRIPRFDDYFLFPKDECKPGFATAADIAGFNTRCGRSSAAALMPTRTPAGTYAFPPSARIINIPHGGQELQSVIKGNLSNGACVAFVIASLADLLVKAIGPMNRMGVGHNDIKAENLMLGPDGNLRIIDWGLGGVSSGQGVPAFVKRRPFQFNLPFSCIFFDRNIPSMHCGTPYDTTPGNSSVPEMMSMFITSINHMPLCGDDLVQNQPSHFKFIMANFVPLVFACNPMMAHTGARAQTFVYVYIDYLTTIIETFSKGGKFDKAAYFKKVYLHNADVWGIVTALIPLLSSRSTGMSSAEKKEVRDIVKVYAYSAEHAAKPIPVAELADRMLALSRKMVSRIGKMKTYSGSALPATWSDKLRSILEASTGAAPVVRKEAETKAKVETKAKAKASATTAHGCPAGTLHFLGRCRTSSGRVASAATRKSQPAKKAKRCPRGTRRNSKTGQCEPK